MKKGYELHDRISELNSVPRQEQFCSFKAGERKERHRGERRRAWALSARTGWKQLPEQGYLRRWSRGHIIQNVRTDVNDLQQVAEELLHHGHQAPVTQSWPDLILFGGCWAGLFFRAP